MLTESQSKLEIPSVPPEENNLELSLVNIKKKAIPAPLFTNEQKVFMAKLQVKLRENKHKKS